MNRLQTDGLRQVESTRRSFFRHCISGAKSGIALLSLTSLGPFANETAGQETGHRTDDVVRFWREVAEDYGKKHGVDMSGWKDKAKGEHWKIAMLTKAIINQGDSTPRLNFHQKAEQSILSGLVPNAKPQLFTCKNGNEPDLWYLGPGKLTKILVKKDGQELELRDTLEFVQFVAENQVGDFVRGATKALNQIRSEGKGKYLAIEESLGMSIYLTSYYVYRMLEDGKDSFVESRKKIYGKEGDVVVADLRGKDDPETKNLKLKAIRHFIVEYAKIGPDNGQLKEELAAYRKSLAATIEEMEAPFVNSNGNWGPEFARSLKSPAEINVNYDGKGFKKIQAAFVDNDFVELTTMTDDDLSVGSCNTRGTIMDVTDDLIMENNTTRVGGFGVDVVAPGSNVTVTVDGKRYGFSETSAATCLMAGAVSLLRLASGTNKKTGQPNLNAKQVSSLVKSSLYDSKAPYSREGGGIFQFDKALKKAEAILNASTRK